MTLTNLKSWNSLVKKVLKIPFTICEIWAREVKFPVQDDMAVKWQSWYSSLSLIIEIELFTTICLQWGNRICNTHTSFLFCVF